MFIFLVIKLFERERMGEREGLCLCVREKVSVYDSESVCLSESERENAHVALLAGAAGDDDDGSIEERAVALAPRLFTCPRAHV